MILVTGAGGTVGTALIGELKAGRHQFRAAYHSSEKTARARAEGHDAISIDFGEPKTLPPALAGVDTVFLLGTGVRGQVEREINVLTAAKAAGVRRLVKLSVWGAADEQFLLAKLHRDIERAVEASGIAWTFLRPNGFMQNFLHDAAAIGSQAAIYEPAADARISHIDVRDVATVAARVLTGPGHENKAYELSGPQALTYGDAADVLSRVLERTIRYVAVSDEDARAGMLSGGMPDFYADHLIDLFRAYRTGIAAQVTPAVVDVTGHAPIAFEQFVRDSALAFR